MFTRIAVLILLCLVPALPVWAGDKAAAPQPSQVQSSSMGGIVTRSGKATSTTGVPRKAYIATPKYGPPKVFVGPQGEKKVEDEKSKGPDKNAKKDEGRGREKDLKKEKQEKDKKQKSEKTKKSAEAEQTPQKPLQFDGALGHMFGNPTGGPEIMQEVGFSQGTSSAQAAGSDCAK